jgi:hydroxyacid-oxoacid transhydrogenase
VSGEETIFTWGAPPLKVGWGASDEIGFDLSQYGVRRVLILTDPGVLETGIPHRIADRLRAYEIVGEIFAEVHVEPTDESMQAAIVHRPSTGRGTPSSPSAAGVRSTRPRRSTC